METGYFHMLNIACLPLLNLPLRNGNELQSGDIGVLLWLLNLPLRNGNDVANRQLDSMEYTFEPSFEEWKQGIIWVDDAQVVTFEPSFEEWKLSSECKETIREFPLLNLPLRNGNCTILQRIRQK